MADTGAAVRRGELTISEPIPFSEDGATFTGPRTVPPGYPSTPQTTDATWPRNRTPTQDLHVRHVSELHPQLGARTSAGPSLLQSSMSSIPSKGSLAQKRPGGIRAALKRMFSSKKHRSVPTDPTNFKYQESGHLDSVQEHQVRMRLDSAPVLGANFATRNAALTSHTHDYHEAIVTEPELSTPPRRGRRATLPSLVLTDTDIKILSATRDWPTIEKAPATSEPKPREDFVSDGQFKRRSRSADALNELVRQGMDDTVSTRDRAGEIAYWRNSAMQNPVPVYSGQSITVDPTHILRPIPSAEMSSSKDDNRSPMQTFDFGLGSPSRDDMPLEQRVNTLEIKVFDFEFALAKLQGHDIPNPRYGRQPRSPGVQHFPNPALKTDTHNHLSATSSQPGGTFLSSPGESPIPSPEEDDLKYRPERASKATTVTVRPTSRQQRALHRSRESSPSSIHIPVRKFEALLDLVNEEKAARLRLEEQVRELRSEVECLRMPIYATIKEPTPSPEFSQNSPNTPRVRPLHRTQHFQLDHSMPTPEISRFSGTGTEDSDVDDGFDEVFETPKEEQMDTFATPRISPRSVRV
jgi:chemotaxis protein histidine kinase CheA